MENIVIVRNLFDLYAYIEEMPQVSSIEDGPFSIITAKGSEWPSMAYNREGDFLRKELSNLKATLNCSTCKTIILQDDIQSDQLAYLKEERFMPVAQWYNMSKELKDDEPVAVPGNLEIFQCGKSELDDWIAVVKNVLFNGKPLSAEVILNGVEDGKFKLLLGKIGDVAVSTILIYCGDTAGIYMVATKPEYQKRGIGKAMMQRAEKIIYESGYDSVQLHATHAGKPLYTSLGYEKYNSLILFYNFN